MRTTPALSPGPAMTPLAACRQRLEQRLGALVGAVLAPHDAEHGQLGVVGVAAELALDGLELLVREAQLAVQRGRLRRASIAQADRLVRSSSGLPGARARRRAIGSPAVRRRGPGPARTSAPDAASARPRCRPRCRRRRWPAASRWDWPDRRDREPASRRRGRSGTAPGRCARARPASPRRRSSSPRRGRPGRCIGCTAGGARERRIEALGLDAGRACRRSAASGCAAARPGTSPASARTWKPLQMPSTWPPAAANSETPRITGLKRAMTPARM